MCLVRDIADDQQDTVYIVGGRKDSFENATSPINEIYIYNITTNTWTTGPPAPMVLSDTCAGSIAGKVSDQNDIFEFLFSTNGKVVPFKCGWNRLS